MNRARAGLFIALLGLCGAAAAESWVTCAREGGTCSYDGNRRVGYGAKGKWVYRNMPGPIACATNTFGSDPVPNTVKSCRFQAAAYPTNEVPAGPRWRRCAAENEDCRFRGARKVVFGAGGKWHVETFVDGVQCVNAIFGDPAPGVKKSCWVAEDGARR